MLNRIRRLLAMLLAAMLCGGMSGAWAESAKEKIELYPQHRYWVTRDLCSYMCRIPLKTTAEPNDMCTSGCMIWAFVHAIEWCRQERLVGNDAAELVKEFVRADSAPWNVLYLTDEDYHRVVRAHGVEIAPKPPTTEKELIGFFRQNGAVICNMGGHCAVAMDYTYFDYDRDGQKEMMVHMVDSAMWSSAEKQTVYDYKTFDWIPATTVCAGEYWLPKHTYENLDRLALLPAGTDEAAE